MHLLSFFVFFVCFFCQAEDGIRDLVRSRGLGDVYKRQFLPRLVAIGRYVTPDEPTWVYRSIQFREALLAGDWAGTLVAGHPGVITTWLGAIGASVHILFSAEAVDAYSCLLYTSPRPRDRTRSRMPSSA